MLVRGLGPSVFSPSLKVMDSSLGSGKVHSSVFVGPFAFSFFCPLQSFRQFRGVIPFGYGSGDPQVVLILRLTPGAAAPCLFHV